MGSFYILSFLFFNLYQGFCFTQFVADQMYIPMHD